MQTLYQTGKAYNLTQEMHRLQIEILGCSRVRWPGNGKQTINDYTFYFQKKTPNLNEVAIIINKNLKKSIRAFLPFSYRRALLKLYIRPCNINIIQIYTPTTANTEDKVENFYQDLDTVLKETNKEEINIILGDFNAKVGKVKVEGIVGELGLGAHNKMGDRRLFNWKAPGNSKENMKEIGFVIIKKRCRNAMIPAKTYPRVDISSEHNILLSVIKLKLKKWRIKQIKRI